MLLLSGNRQHLGRQKEIDNCSGFLEAGSSTFMSWGCEYQDVLGSAVENMVESLTSQLYRKGDKNTRGKSGQRAREKPKIQIIGAHSPVAQLLHPFWLARDDIVSMGYVLQLLDERLSSSAPEVRLVVSGGGLIQINHNRRCSYKTWRSEEALEELVDLVRERMRSVANALEESKRDFVIGVDVLDAIDTPVGQFAVLVTGGEIETIAWKSFPVGGESKWLAGFGTVKGRNSPRIVSTALGKTLLLVCHDSQAYNHRNRALILRAHRSTLRTKVINSMTELIKAEKPEWALNLIHQIDKEQSIKTFRTSYTQIHSDYGVPGILGAFGYGPNVQAKVARLATRTQYPDGKAGVVAILESN